jgi:hypothetical protein
MLIIIKKILRPLYDKPFCDHLRAWLGIQPPFFLRPLRMEESISDLFLWRVDDTWETQYELMNLPSLLVPGKTAVDNVTMIIYDAYGNDISRNIIKLNPFESKKILIRSLLKGVTGQGTFGCFHSTDSMGEVQKAGCYLVDRQYVSYSWKDDIFFNYVHGNIYGLSKLATENKARSLVPMQRKTQIYKPQLRFDDCDSFELIYSNPAEETLELLVRLFDENWNEIERRDSFIPSRGLEVLKFENSSRKLVLVENQSQIGLCRPIIFKHYESFFDVFHG